MDTALGILSRSLQSPTSTGAVPSTGQNRSTDLFAALFNQFANNQGLQSAQLARATPLPAPTIQTVPSDPRPTVDSAADNSTYNGNADASSSASADGDTSSPTTDTTDSESADTADAGAGQTAASSTADAADAAGTFRPQADGSFKPMVHARRDGKADKTAKENKSDQGGASDKTAESDGNPDAHPVKSKGKADRKNDAATADDGSAPSQTATGQTTGDPILAAVPMLAPQMTAAKPVQAGDGGTDKTGAVAGKGQATAPPGKNGATLKGADAAPLAAGSKDVADPSANAADAAAAPTAGPQPDTGSGPQSGAAGALSNFAAALSGSGAGPQPAMLQARDLQPLTPSVAVGQLVQGVDAGTGGGGDGGDAGLTGDGGSGNAQGGANAGQPDGSLAAGGADAVRDSGGADFAGTLASVRSGRPGMPTGATDQVAVQLQHSAKDGNGTISMQLRPEELGRIDVKLNIDQQGVVNATITADRPQTLELLQRDSHHLEKALQDAGLQTDSGSLNFNLRGETGQGSNQQGYQGDGNRSGRPPPELAARATDSPTPDVAVVTRRYQVATGRIDVRI